MRAGVLEWSACVFGELFDGRLPLAQEVEQLDTLRARERVADAGELRVERVFELAVRHVDVVKGGRRRSGALLTII